MKREGGILEATRGFEGRKGAERWEGVLFGVRVRARVRVGTGVGPGVGVHNIVETDNS